jgi:hypothetical protein
VSCGLHRCLCYLACGECFSAQRFLLAAAGAVELSVASAVSCTGLDCGNMIPLVPANTTCTPPTSVCATKLNMTGAVNPSGAVSMLVHHSLRLDIAVMTVM